MKLREYVKMMFLEYRNQPSQVFPEFNTTPEPHQVTSMNLPRTGRSLTAAECVEIGGHCWQDTGMRMSTGYSSSQRQHCKHCPAYRDGQSREPWVWTYHDDTETETESICPRCGTQVRVVQIGDDTVRYELRQHLEGSTVTWREQLHTDERCSRRRA